MLKQVYVLKGEEILYSQELGSGFSPENFAQVKSILDPFISDPVDGMVFDRPLFNFQAIYVSVQGLFFLMVVNLSDWPNDLKMELMPLTGKFLNIFRDVANDVKNAAKQEEFKRCISEMHDRLFPKISLPEAIEKGEFTVLTPSYGETEESLTVTSAPEDKKVKKLKGTQQCPICGLKINPTLTEASTQTIKKFPFGFVVLHGSPLHALIMYIDANFTVRGMDSSQIIDLPADQVTLQEILRKFGTFLLK